MKASRALPVLAALLLLGGCARVIDDTVAGAISKPATEVRARTGDRDRADRLAEQVRESIARFRDVEAAEAAGHRSFPPEPGPTDRMIHYVNRDLSQREVKRIDTTRPGALLYERDGEGGLRLVGAMFTAPVEAPIEELNARVPLSATQWHLHQNVCVPRPLWDKQQWARKLPGDRPAFGPGSPTHTEAACDQLGGRFLPTVFGWMAHVYVFAKDPTDTWNAHYGHGGGPAPHGSGHH